MTLSGCMTTSSERLSEIQKDLKALSGEVAQIRQAITEIHRNVVVSGAKVQASEPSIPSVQDINLDQDDPVLGKQNAKIAIVEFSDYQCPFCKRYHTQTFPKLKAQYIDTGKIQYIFKDYPLPFHDQAKGAARAANCIGKGANYWKMNDELFANQASLGSELYKSLAVKLKVNAKNFEACLKSDNSMKEIEKDIAYAGIIGISGTPSFFIGRLQEGKIVAAKMISGAQPFSSFAEAIDGLK